MNWGLTFTVDALIADGPLAGMRFRIGVPSLADIPERLDYADGTYARKVEDGVQWLTSDGGPVYAWEPATVGAGR